MAKRILDQLYHAVVVSVQAGQGEPLNKDTVIAAMAQSAVMGGARGLRVANPENIRAVKEVLPEVPVIGITKPPHMPPDPENHVYITPSLWTVETVLEAGADMVAMDATARPRPGGEPLDKIVACARERYPACLLMADVATLEEGVIAADMGFDVVSTTLSGYTANTLARGKDGLPDFALLEALAKAVDIPVFLEGRIWEPAQVTEAFNHGAYGVVIGSAITRPHEITRRFVNAVPTLHPQP